MDKQRSELNQNSQDKQTSEAIRLVTIRTITNAVLKASGKKGMVERGMYLRVNEAGWQIKR